MISETPTGLAASTMRSVWLFCAVVAPLVAHARIITSIRGGQVSDAAADLASNDVGTPLEVNQLETYVNSLANFMQTFEELKDKASSTCKKSVFLGLRASETRVRQRADRLALLSAHRQIRELYLDAVSHACAERQHLFAATTLRLHVLLTMLLREPDTDTDAPSQRLPPPELIPPDDVAALEALRTELVRKPKGTVAEVCGQLRSALEVPASAHLTMLYTTLMQTPAGVASDRAPSARDAPTADATTPEAEGAASSLDGWDDAEGSTFATAAAPPSAIEPLVTSHDDLEAEVQMALQQAEEAAVAQQASLLEAERQVSEHSAARLAAEEEAAAAHAKLAELEPLLEQSRAQMAQSAGDAESRAADATAARAKSEEELVSNRAALEHAQSEANEMRAALDAGAVREHDVRERLRLASAAAAQAQAAEGTARSQAAHVAEQLNALQATHAALASSHHALEQQRALYEQLQQQVAHRVHQLVQLGRDLPEGSAPPVPLVQHRELQLELMQQGERLGHTQHLHAVNLHALERMHAEAQASAATVAELTRRLEIADAQMHAAAAFQPPPTPQVQSQPQPPLLQGEVISEQLSGVTSAVKETLEDTTSKMKEVGGSLVSMLGKRAKQVSELSKGFVGDLTGLVDDAPSDRQPSSSSAGGGMHVGTSRGEGAAP